MAELLGLLLLSIEQEIRRASHRITYLKLQQVSEVSEVRGREGNLCVYRRFK